MIRTLALDVTWIALNTLPAAAQPAPVFDFESMLDRWLDRPEGRQKIRFG